MLILFPIETFKNIYYTLAYFSFNKLNLLQEVMRYQERINSQQDIERRPHKEYDVPTIEKFNGNYYLIASDIYDLSNNGKIIDDEVLSQFPVIPCYVGDRLDFQDDEYEAYRLLMEIIGNFNKLQDPKFYSFPLGILTKKKFAIS